MSQLLPYDFAAHCPKCGHKDVSTHYVSASYWARYDCRHHPSTNEEHLHRWCRRCDYQWAERCIDLQKQGEEAGAERAPRSGPPQADQEHQP